MKKGRSKLSPKALGALTLVLFLLAGWAAFQKERIGTWLTFGHESFAAEFPNRAKLIGDDLTYDHTVKLNGVIVGKVTTIDETDRGTMIAHVLVDPGTRKALGSTPSAFIQPTLVTDGVQFLGLQTGGDPNQPFTGDLIPMERTKLPVYLDDVLQAISSKDAIKGVRATINDSNDTLHASADSIHQLVASGQQDLEPAGVVLDSFRGTNKDSDLTRLVQSLESASSAFNQQQGQFSSTVHGLKTSFAALSAGSNSLSQAIAIGPDTLRTSRAGLDDLRPTLEKLRVTSDDFRPSARKLDDFLQEFGPVIHRHVKTFDDLKDVMHDARPIFDHLEPVAENGAEVLDDIKGPVLKRVNGPIKDRLYSPWVGKDEYKGSSSDGHTLTDTIAYLFSVSSNVWKHYDSNNALARLEAGGGGQSIGGSGFPPSAEEAAEMFGLQQPVGPNNSAVPNLAPPVGQRDAPAIGGRRGPAVNFPEAPGPEFKHSPLQVPGGIKNPPALGGIK